jgi:small subunit ribosomal protein S8
MTDPIADLLTRIRNAIAAQHPKVDIPHSRLKGEVARILKEEGYITNFSVKSEGHLKTLRIFLRYGTSGESAISYIQRVSRSSRRVYTRFDDRQSGAQSQYRRRSAVQCVLDISR